MPSLPELEQRPGRIERTAQAVRRAGVALGVDARVSARVLVFLLVAAVCVSTAPVPWAQIGAVALVGLGLDWARKRV